MAMRCDVYTRLSRDREDQTSTTRQRRDCVRLAEAKGWDVVQVHEDVDFSAYRQGVRRPGYEAMIERVKAGATDAVVIWKIDRLARNLREFLRFADLCDKRGVALVSVNEPFDTSSPIGRAIMQVLAVFAELEGATIGMRVKSARRFAAEHGLPSSGGKRGYGYTHQMELVPDEADAIRDAARRIMEGESAYAIAKEWNEAGRLTTAGNRWSPAMLLRMLRNPRLAGLRVYKGEVIGEGSWEPILDRATHEALVKAKRTQWVGKRSYLLSGLLICEGCGSKMVGHPRGKERTYRCPTWAPYNGCGRAISADRTEEWITQLTFAALERPEVVRALQVGRDASSAEGDTMRKLHEVEQRMAELGEDYAAGLIPRPAFQAASAKLREEAEALERRVAVAAQRGPLHGVAARDVFAEWERRDDVAWRRQVVQAIFDRIGVREGRPGARFDPGRLTPVPVQ